jgi:formylglycine-generating enzyme required for sulfatase activity
LSGLRFPRGNTISQSQADYYGRTATYSYDLGPNLFNPIFGTGGTPFTGTVGYFAPNGYGIFDMAGNVYGWCWDWYGASYAGGSDPHGPDSGSQRIIRGGAWNSFANVERCASRVTVDPTQAADGIGFRCVRGF